MTGFRGVGEVSFEWERSAADTDSDYAPLPGATLLERVDETAPANGEARYYRVRVSPQGASPVTTAGARGFRAVAPAVVTQAATGQGATALRALGTLVSPGVPATIGVGFCLATHAAPREGAQGVLCSPAQQVAGGPFEHTFTQLTPGKTYFVRAWARHPHMAWTYGDNTSVLLIPAAPTGLAATKGTSTADVALHWTASVGASGYRIFRDNQWLADVSGTTWTDSTATAAGPPLAPAAFSASNNRIDRVSLAWSAAATPPGASHLYAVEAQNASGSGQRTPEVAGFRGSLPVSKYELSEDGQSWMSVGSPSRTTTSPPRWGSSRRARPGSRRGRRRSACTCSTAALRQQRAPHAPTTCAR